MKSENYSLIKYEADENKVFEYAVPRYQGNEDGEQIQEHLYAKVLFIWHTDSIENYIEVEEILDRGV